MRQSLCFERVSAAHIYNLTFGLELRFVFFKFSDTDAVCHFLWLKLIHKLKSLKFQHTSKDFTDYQT